MSLSHLILSIRGLGFSRQEEVGPRHDLSMVRTSSMCYGFTKCPTHSHGLSL